MAITHKHCGGRLQEQWIEIDEDCPSPVLVCSVCSEEMDADAKLTVILRRGEIQSVRVDLSVAG